MNTKNPSIQWKNKGGSVQEADSSFKVKCFLFQIQEAGNESRERAGSCRQLMASGNYFTILRALAHRAGHIKG